MWQVSQEPEIGFLNYPDGHPVTHLDESTTSFKSTSKKVGYQHSVQSVSP
jgi:hypothetical protein